MKVTILDTKTGAKHETGDDFDAYWWAEGNGSCDCNRNYVDGLDVTGGFCCGTKRFLIVAASNEEFTLAELNEGYPPELLKKHGITP